MNLFKTPYPMATYHSENLFSGRHSLIECIRKFNSFMDQNRLPNPDDFNREVAVFDFVNRLSKAKEVSVFESPVFEIEKKHKVIKPDIYLPELVEGFILADAFKKKVEGRHQINLLSKPLMVGGHRYYTKFFVTSESVEALYLHEEKVFEALHGEWHCTFWS